MRSDVRVDMQSPRLVERRIDGVAGLPTLVVGVAALIGGTRLVGRALSELIEHRRGADFVPFYLAGLLLIGLGIAALRGLLAVAPRGAPRPPVFRPPPRPL